MYILSVDFGTSSVKAAILNEKLETLVWAKSEYQFNVYDNDKVELDPELVFTGFIDCTRKMKEYIHKVELVSFDTFSPSVVLMDREGNALYPVITHLDRRSMKQSQEICEVMGEEEYQKITGILPFIGGASITSMMWMKENEPEIFNNAYMLGHYNTYIYKKLTGIWATEYVNASMMGLYETVKETGWSKEICETFGIPMKKLPEVYQAGSILGHLRKEIAEITGLKEGIPVALGGNDAATAQVGAGNTKVGDVLHISGSSEMVSILTDKPIVNKKYYLRKAATPGMWQIFAITVGGFAIDWFRKEFYSEMDINQFYNTYLVDIIKNRLDNKTVEFMPYLAGDRQSLEKKRGAFTGLTLDTTREDMLVSILIGMHNPVIETIKLAQEFMELNKRIKITGGLTGEEYISLKKKIFKGFQYEIVDDCPIIGNVKLALMC
ncbi:sugar kinase [Alkalicella caledoniensis]|uniref:Sugar kinase n=1 Tax=Alkalicella caledoniensis TaxID=2731377 RepID=A0A7G9WAV9_ALKCA|nr:FGGY family carbohydrate kinase [Alkalicella caledoniensis]QNO15821.1 sugar kinase [Alkalicella caledoniensis]